MPPSQTDTFRLIAPIGPIVGKRQTIHSLRSADGAKEFMPIPQVVLVESGEHGCMLYRYRVDRTFCGDTWHESLEDAKAQCCYEYGPALGPWMPIPASVRDALSFAIASVGAQAEA